MVQKRVLAIHDISCFGRCSLTVALPIISATGSECTVIPTAVLSTHTGGFTGFTYRDLTEDIVPIVDHWKTLNLGFDYAYSGFLGSFEQIDIVKGIFEDLRDNGTKLAVDPVMADNGKLYTIFPENYPSAMRELCKIADVLMPNITEACLLLDEEYIEGPYTKEWVEDILVKLADMGAKNVILTGVYFDEDHLGSAAYCSETGITEYSFNRRIPGYYHGTGDVFGSVVVGSLACGKTLAEAGKLAVDFTVGSIARTKDEGTDIRFGVNFEAGLPQLMKDLGL